MPELTLDVQALRDGVFYGLMLGLCAGGSGWMIRLCIKMFNNLIGR